MTEQNESPKQPGYFEQLLRHVALKVVADLIVAVCCILLCGVVAWIIVRLLGPHIGVKPQHVMMVFGLLSLVYIAVVLVVSMDRHRYFAGLAKIKANVEEKPEPKEK